jgi:hypothetical protein
MSFDTPTPPFNASDPQASFIGLSCFDLLLIEIVPMAYRMAEQMSEDWDKLDDQEQQDAAFYRLEILGYRVGMGLAER